MSMKKALLVTAMANALMGTTNILPSGTAPSGGQRSKSPLNNKQKKGRKKNKQAKKARRTNRK